MQRHQLYRCSRSTEITCLTFGANRKEDFPDHFFCHGCDLVEDAVMTSMNRHPNRNSKRYRCTGGHTDLTKPTTLKKLYRPSNVRPERPAGSSLSFKSNRDRNDVAAEEMSITTSDTRETTSSSVTNNVQGSECNFDELGKFAESIHDNGIMTPAPHRDVLSCDPRRLFTAADSFSTLAAPSYTPAPPADGAQSDNAAVANAPLTCTTVSSISTGNSSTVYELELEITLLRQRCLELDERNASLDKTVQVLTAQIAAAHCQQRAQRQECWQTGKEKAMQIHPQTNDDLNVLKQYDNDDSNAATAAEKLRKQRLRVCGENLHLTQTLSTLIENFISRTDLADRRKFPESRLAKIVVDSVTVFEWTHSEIMRFARSQQRTTSTTTTNDEYNTTTQQELTSALLAVLHKRKQGRHRSDKRKAALLVECVWDDGFLNGEAKACIIDKVRQYLRQHVFSPWKILKAMDIAGFKLSLTGIELLRRVENSSKYGRGSLPSKSTILRSARKLEAAASAVCPYTMIGRSFCTDLQNDEIEDNVVGEGFEFDAIKVTETLFRAYGLMDEAKRRPVELGLASDGAQLTNTISHVAAGLKFNDVAMRDPITKQPMLLHSPDSLVQSRNLCFPLRIVIAKDSKKTLEGFRSLYKSFNAGEVAEALECRPFKMSFPGDMKLQWSALDEGGAAKVKEKFCYICPCRSSTIHIPQDKTKCPLCINKTVLGHGEEDGEDECYHYPFFPIRVSEQH